MPFFDYVGERETLVHWAESRGPERLERYWREKNVYSIDGFAMGLVEKPEG